jgi:2-hydroxy-6-oxonona-2,4-dienedioate hydrolase
VTATILRTGSAAERWTQVDGLRLFARAWTDRAPAGAPLVVGVHGLVVSSAYFVPTAHRLSAHARFLAPDLPGFGRSDKPDSVLDVGGLARALVAWLEATGSAPATLLANSFGCQIAAEAAMRRPDLVARLVLVSPTMDPTARTVGQQLRRWRRESKTQSTRLQLLLLRDYARAGLGRARRTFLHALEHRIEDVLPFVDAPTLVVRGTADPIVPQAWAEEVARLLPHGHLRVLPDVPHAMNHDAPDALVDAVVPFLHQ